MMKIDAIVYSYKNKNLRLVVESLLKNTVNDIFIYVFDQHPLDRSYMFQDNRISYEHIPWDAIQSPCERRGNIVNVSNADYILQLSDDIVVSNNWDQSLIAFISEGQRIVSGNKKVKLENSEKFFLKVSGEKSSNFELSGYIDRNFIFAARNIWNSIAYPYYLKYNGEEEIMSLDFFRAGKSMYSAPESTYEDLNVRTLENIYVPFSKNHNYNEVVKNLNGDVPKSKKTFPRSRNDFLKFHGIESLHLKELPFSTNDVLYNPYGLSFQDIDARKFISKTKAIY